MAEVCHLFSSICLSGPPPRPRSREERCWRCLRECPPRRGLSQELSDILGLQRSSDLLRVGEFYPRPFPITPELVFPRTSRETEVLCCSERCMQVAGTFFRGCGLCGDLGRGSFGQLDYPVDCLHGFAVCPPCQLRADFSQEEVLDRRLAVSFLPTFAVESPEGVLEEGGGGQSCVGHRIENFS